MIKKSVIAILIGTIIFMTACSGGTASESTGAEVSENESEVTESKEKTDMDLMKEAMFEMSDDTYDSEMPEEEIELNNGTLTIRLYGDRQKEGYIWTYYTGDKGDATLVDLLTQTNDDGCLYAGSFRAFKDSGDGKDYIRLVYTNDIAVYYYIDVTVSIEDSMIVDSMIMEMAPLEEQVLDSLVLGNWQQENDGIIYMDVTKNEKDGYDFIISDGSGRDGSSVYYTMTAYYDIIKEAFLYVNGTDNTAAATDGQGTGVFIMDSDGESGNCINIEWIDQTDSHDPIRFVKQ